jgi:hypothetical protein
MARFPAALIEKKRVDEGHTEPSSTRDRPRCLGCTDCFPMSFVMKIDSRSPGLP